MSKPLTWGIEIVGRLHGIYAGVGTVIGYHSASRRFLAVASISRGELLIRYATGEEINRIGTIAPRSVAEHAGIPRRKTPYGEARIYGPRPYVKPQIVRSNYRKELQAQNELKKLRRRMARVSDRLWTTRDIVIGRRDRGH